MRRAQASTAEPTTKVTATTTRRRVLASGGSPCCPRTGTRRAASRNARSSATGPLTGSPPASATGTFVAGQGLLALVVVVDDALRIPVVVPGAMLPGFVGRRAGQVAQLRHPAAHVVAVGVELAALRHRVEDPEVGRGVRAGAGHPLPAVVVGGDVPVDEVVEEVPGPDRPPHVEVLGEEAGRDHPHPIVHPALLEQLPHAGVDDRVAGAPLPPGVDEPV